MTAPLNGNAASLSMLQPGFENDRPPNANGIEQLVQEGFENLRQRMNPNRSTPSANLAQKKVARNLPNSFYNPNFLKKRKKGF